MAGNTLLTISMITKTMIKLFLNTNIFIQNIDRQFDSNFGIEGAMIGAQLRIRLPPDYTVTDGPGLSLQDTIEQQIPLVVAYQRHVDTGYTTVDRTLSLDDYMYRIGQQKANVLAGNVAQQIMQGVDQGGCSNIAANLDAAGNILVPNAGTYALAGALLDDNSAPDLGTRGIRKVVNDPHTDYKVAVSLQGLFNPAPRITQQFETATMKEAVGFGWFRDQTVIKHTAGSFTAGTVNGAGQIVGSGNAGGSLTVNAITGTLNQGDIITIAGVNAVNRVTKVSTGSLRQFVVTANVASGATSIPIYPPLIPPAGSAAYAGLSYTAAQYQTVTASPANSAAISLYTLPSVTYRKSIAYAPDAITMVCAPLFMPTKGVVEAARHEMDDVSMRSIVAYLPGTDQIADRLDVLFGYLYIRPEWICAVVDTTSS